MKALKSVKIASGGSQSEAVDLEHYELAGLIMPSAWTAAAITLLAADGPNATFAQVVDDAGTELSITVAASQIIGIGTEVKQGAVRALKWVKLRSGTAGVPVNQAADRTIHLLLTRVG